MNPDPERSSSRPPSQSARTTQGYAIISDIVGFSEKESVTQVEWVAEFLQILGQAVRELKQFNIFPTGDGAIVCIYHEGPPSRETAILPLNFARTLLRLNTRKLFKLRISINYSGMETLLDLSSFEALVTSQIQVGNGINLAERLIHFAEPNEIVVTGQYYDQLLDVGFSMQPRFYIHRDVFVKHMRTLRLFSYKPTADEEEYIYHPPTKDEQHFKRYAYFPPLRSDTIERFRQLDLRHDLEQLCRYAYDTIAAVNRERIYISWESVYDVLKNVPPDGEDEILVISRSDRPGNFWSTPASRKYLRYLRKQSEGKRFVQNRIFLYDPDREESIAPEDVLSILRELHAVGTLHSLDVAYTHGNVLMNYLFGVTIFPRLHCAVAPIPTPDSYDDYLQTIVFGRPQDAFRRFSDADFQSSGFKALVIANEETVDDLVTAFEALRRHRGLEAIN